MRPSEIPFQSAIRLAAEIRAGSLSAVEVASAFIERIDVHGRRVGALAHFDKAAALREATHADRALAAGRPLGPLHGLPMTLKDAFRAAGSRSSFGVPSLKFYRPAADCEVVARVRRAGAVLLGRTAVPFACFEWQCRPPLARECINPIDPARTCGGSSSGAAAALAARFTPLELGSDVAGSIRYPAHCCGVLGLRTSVGLLPLADSGPPPGIPVFPSTLSAGPMARSIEDLALLLSVLVDAQAPEVKPNGTSNLRIAVTTSIDEAPTSEPTAKVLREYTQRLADEGCDVRSVERPPFDFEQAFEIWGLLSGYEMKLQFPRWLRSRTAMRAFAAWFLRFRLGAGPLTEYFRAGLLASDAEYREGLTRRNEVVRAVDFFFERHDLWIFPVSPGPAILRQRPGRPIPTNHGPVAYSRYLGEYLCPTALPGTPALVLPAGLAGQMPVGVQVHAPRFADRWLVERAGPMLAGAGIPPPLPDW